MWYPLSLICSTTGPTLITQGRLDIESEGLILLTNDGNLARYLELPESKMVRTYHVTVRGEVRVTCIKSMAFYGIHVLLGGA